MGDERVSDKGTDDEGVDDDGMAIEFTGVPLDDLEHLRNLIRFNAEDPNAVEDEFDSHIGLKPRDPE